MENLIIVDLLLIFLSKIVKISWKNSGESYYDREFFKRDQRK